MLEPIHRPAASPSGAALAAGHDLPFHYESRREIAAPAEVLFSYLDDHARLSGHMSQSSWMMAGSRMDIEADAAKGQAVGSRIRLKGRVLGISLEVEEAVTRHEPPFRKVWETIGLPRLLVIGHYRMGFDVKPRTASSLLRVFIDYALPGTPLAGLVGRALGGFYARWCTESMAKDAAAHFAHSERLNHRKGLRSLSSERSYATIVRRSQVMGYTFNRTVDGTFDAVVERTIAALKVEGLGVLSDLDIQATLKAKLGVDFQRYRILGACNPPLALRALQAEPTIGVMLPCNVVVRETSPGKVEVAAINPLTGIGEVGNPSLSPIATEVAEKLRRVVASI
jgi:uncharacterized protein (DUF302 family)